MPNTTTYNILSSNDEDSSGNVSKFLTHVNPFDTSVQHQVGELIHRSENMYMSNL